LALRLAASRPRLMASASRKGRSASYSALRIARGNNSAFDNPRFVGTSTSSYRPGCASWASRKRSYVCEVVSFGVRYQRPLIFEQPLIHQGIRLLAGSESTELGTRGAGDLPNLNSNGGRRTGQVWAAGNESTSLRGGCSPGTCSASIPRSLRQYAARERVCPTAATRLPPALLR
jgi:hypothetical protein